MDIYTACAVQNIVRVTETVSAGDCPYMRGLAWYLLLFILD